MGRRAMMVRAAAVVALGGVVGFNVWLLIPNKPVSAAAPQAAAPAPERVTRRATTFSAAHVVTAADHPSVKSVIEGKEKKLASRLTPLAPPTPFDKAAFAKDPHAYLDVVEPGRILDVASSDAKAPTLDVVGNSAIEIAPLGMVTLTLQAVPKAPVSFTSMGLGAFDNKLTSITVQADDKGIAKVHFTAIEGTVESVHIAAGSPLCSGQAGFVVFVVEPVAK